ncbi:MAG TPA: hypothetical protein VFF73_26920 [Planctomycetota bacterium]|nr:hypothetical protein [Planctomycetota bacterium]
MARAVVATLLALTLLGAPALRAQDAMKPEEDAKTLLEKGQDAEKTKVEDAVAIYQDLLNKYPNDAVAARAHLRLAICFARIGGTEGIEAARREFRVARKLGKDDKELQAEAEKGLIALPPPPEPKPAEKPVEKKPEPAKPAPQPQPETGPRAELAAEIAKLEDERRDLTKKAQDLEDAGKTAQAYQVRAEMDKKVAEIERKKKELAGMPKGGQQTPKQTRQERREEKKEEKKQEKKADAKPADGKPAADEKQKMMATRRDQLDSAAKSALQKALDLLSQDKPQEAAAAYAEHAALRHEVELLDKKTQTNPRSELQQRLQKAKEDAAQAEKSGDAQAIQHTKDAVVQAETALQSYDGELAALDERQQAEQLAAELRKRNASEFETDERVALLKREMQADREHRKMVAALQREIEDKKVPEAEGREKIQKLNREHHQKIQRMRDETDGRVHERARQEMEKELARRAEELKQSGLGPADVEARIAALRKEMEPKLPGKRLVANETDEATAQINRQKRIQHLEEENKKLKAQLEEREKRIQALEKENQELKGQKPAESKPANTPN